MKPAQVAKAANGHICIQTGSWFQAKRIGLLLMFLYYFKRKGPWIPGIGAEALYPDYIKGNLLIISGWERMMGYDFLSDNDDTDAFLTDFIREHLTHAKWM